MENTILEHKFYVLDTEIRNRNHRFYVMDIVSKWPEHQLLTEGDGFDVEYAMDDEKIEKDYLQEHLSCGLVTKLEFEGTKLFATVKFKKNLLTEDIYSGKIKLEDLTVTPKGNGSIKNQKIQDDYELYGFNLIRLSESAFYMENEEKESVGA